MELGKETTRYQVMLYPLKFKPQHIPKIWGSESWQVSCYGQFVSVVSNGSLAGDTLQDLLETYMDELVGEPIYSIYGNRFPLLEKFIDAQDALSVQVHPDDMTAYDRHREWGKTEMWYVVDAAEGATLVLGFAQETDMEELQQTLAEHRLKDLLHLVPIQTGDVIFLPAGTVHALNKGVQVAEIQQSSDLTYRIYDYDRLGLDGKMRPLHIQEALEVIDYTVNEQPKIEYNAPELGSVNLIDDVHFTTNLLCFNREIGRDYALLDSFVTYMCVEGDATIRSTDCDQPPIRLSKGETVLIPACLNDVQLVPLSPKVRLLETYIQTAHVGE